ncbi:MAG TPA: GAF domain-containing protein, partial [Anaerolineae bacterium]|nr:GAF domain-containing protein [Anaerolineae bacterium]
GDANLLRSLANQVAISIRNARQFTQVEKALAEAHAAQQRYLEQAWQKTKLIAKGSQYLYKESDTVGVDEVQRQMFTRAHQEALAIDHPTVVTLEGGDSERNALIAPIRLRGKFIGDIQLHASNSNAWGEDELVVIETILAQLAQSAENLRLFDETRQRAGRERTIREITERMRTATSLEELVKTTAQELGERLAAGHAIVELGIEAGSVVADSHNWQDGNEQKH